MKYLIKEMKQFKTLTLTKKVQMIGLFVIWIWLIGWATLSWGGRGFPLESELNYSEGIVDSFHAGDGNHVFMLLDITNLNRKQNYGCSYSALTSQSSRACIDKKALEPLEGKKAVVGWYMLKDFSGVHNGIRQMVTLEVQDAEVGTKGVRTYQYTADLIKRRNKHLYVAQTIVFMFCTYWLWRFYDWVG